MERRQRVILTRIITAYILLFLAIRFYLHVTPSRLMAPPLSNGYMDITYWLFRLSGLPAFIMQHHAVAVCFDGLLFFTGVLTLFFPLRRRWLIPFSVLLFVLGLIYNNYNLHHNQTMSGFMLVLIAFWPKDNETCGLLWQGTRYFACIIYPLSFFWKTVYGKAFFYWPQGTGSMRGNLVEYMYMNPGSFFSGVCKWFLEHSWLLNFGAMAVSLMEALMIIGLFTRRFDRILFWFPVVIHVSTYFFADVFYLEFLVVDISFLSMAFVSRMGKRLPLLTAGY